MTRKGIADYDRATYRDFVNKFHNVLYDMGRRGQLGKPGEGPGA